LCSAAAAAGSRRFLAVFRRFQSLEIDTIPAGPWTSRYTRSTRIRKINCAFFSAAVGNFRQDPEIFTMAQGSRARIQGSSARFEGQVRGPGSRARFEVQVRVPRFRAPGSSARFEELLEGQVRGPGSRSRFEDPGFEVRAPGSRIQVRAPGSRGCSMGCSMARFEGLVRFAGSTGHGPAWIHSGAARTWILGRSGEKGKFRPPRKPIQRILRRSWGVGYPLNRGFERQFVDGCGAKSSTKTC